MRRKVYVPGAAALLAAVLCSCTGGSADEGGATDGKPGTGGTTAAAAQPGKYGTLPEPCGVLDHGTLDSLLPGLKQVDEDERDKAYQGTMSLTYDNERRVGCHWKAEDAEGSDALRLDFERVVSYDAGVSDDDSATSVYEKLETAANLPAAPGTAPVVTPSPTDSEKSTDKATDKATDGGTGKGADTRSGKDAAEGAGPDGGKGDEETPDASAGTGASSSTSGENGKDTSPSSTTNPDNEGSGGDSDVPGTPLPELLPRLLSGLGNSAFLDDQLAKAGAATGRRTVTVVFRTSNVVVSVEYEQQPARAGELPDSKEMQDKAQKVARTVADSFDE